MPPTNSADMLENAYFSEFRKVSRKSSFFTIVLHRNIMLL